MTKYNISNLKLSNLQLNKLKLRLKDDTEVTLNLSWNVIGNSNDETNFRHRLLLTNTKVSRLYKAFGNNSSAKIKLSKTRLHKIGKSGGFLSRLLGPLLKSGLLLMKGVLEPLTKSVLVPLRLAAVAPETDVFIKKKKKIMDQVL